jgi:hypothetical protein
LDLETEVKSLAVQAATFKITNDQELFAAGKMRETIKAMRQKIAESFDKPIADAFKAHKSILAAKKAQDDPLDDGDRTLKQSMIGYTNSQEQKRKLDQARLDLEAKKKAEEQALELAQTLFEAGATDAAAAVLEEPVQVAPTILPSTPKISGFSKRRIYSAEVVDRGALLSAIHAGIVPQEAWQPDMQFLNKQANALKEALTWPGVKVVWREV